MTRYLIALGALVGVLLFPARALADPTNAKNAFPVTISCSDGNTYGLILNAGLSPYHPDTGSPWNAPHIVVGGSGPFRTVYLAFSTGGGGYLGNGGANGTQSRLLSCTGSVDFGAGPVGIIALGFIP
jgi:hypothetical protein